MKRRKFLFAAGAAATVCVLPRIAQESWLRVAIAHAPVDGFEEAQLALVTAMADTIIPRTNTPSASEVGVPAWVNFMVTDYLTDSERADFLAGLVLFEQLAMESEGVSFAAASTPQRQRLIATLDNRSFYERVVMHFERPANVPPLIGRVVGYRAFNQVMAELAPRARAYWRLKELVITGYFTSEEIQKNVLKVNIMPGYFDGAAPMSAASRQWS